MGITYNAGTNTITVTGYTEGTPCTFLHIVNADDLGGWGVFKRACANQYCLAALLVIGDGSTPTWFSDSQVLLTLRDAIVASTGTFIRGTVNSHIELTKSGIVDHENSNTHIIIGGLWASTPASDVKIDFCSFVSLFDTQIRFITAGYIKNSVLNGRFIIGDSGTGFSIERITHYEGTKVGYGIINAKGTVNDVSIEGVAYAIYFWGSTSVTMKNLKIRDSNNTFYGDTITADMYVINPDCDSWIIAWNNATHKIYRQYEFDLKVIQSDLARTPISGATVKIWNKDNTLVVDTTTDVNGDIAKQTLNFGYYDQAHGSTAQMKTPHKIEISTTTDPFKTVQKYMYMDYKRKEVLTMENPQPLKICDNELILQLCPKSVSNDENIYTKI